MSTPVSKKETVGTDTAERQVVKLSVFEQKSAVKIVAAIFTAPFSEYRYSVCNYNIIAPFGEKSMEIEKILALSQKNMVSRTNFLDNTKGTF